MTDSHRTPEDQLRCEVCERPVLVELGLNPAPQIICTDCETKQPKRVCQVCQKPVETELESYYCSDECADIVQAYAEKDL